MNKVSTCVTLRFDVAGSPSLNNWQRTRIMTKLANRITKDGALLVTAQDTRSQSANKELATQRFATLLLGALKQDPPRKKTRPTLAAKQRRITAKKQRAGTKQSRSKPRPDQD